jgi:hypothetical protein
MARPIRCAPPVTRAARGMPGGIASERDGMKLSSPALLRWMEGVD